MVIRLRRPFALVAALLTATLLTPLAPASAQPDRYAAIDAYLRDRMEETHAPGLAYAVVGPDGPLHQRSWGTDGNGERVTAETPFLWGSVAKPVTATAVMTLVQAGRLGLDDRVADHLPEFRFGGPAHASQVTVRHLLEQTAGIPGSATSKVTDCFGAGCPGAAGRLGALDDVAPLGPPGTEYAYSSANYLVLTAVVESVTGRPFAEHLRRTVLDPAGMDGAIADAASARKENLPPGHRYLWGVPSATDGFDDHGAGYGYLGGDLDDLAAFASLQLRGGKTPEGRTVLTDESVRLMRQDGRLGQGYGLGWRVGGLDAPLNDAIWHTGGSPGYSALLLLLPRQNVALVLHQNIYGLLQDGAVMQAGFGAAELLAGGMPNTAPSASLYLLAVWATTGTAAALVLAAGRSAFLLRRPPVATTRRRRLAVTAGWTLAGAIPLILAVGVARQMGLGPLAIWAPDLLIGGCVAAAAGAATIILRGTLAIRSHRHSP